MKRAAMIYCADINLDRYKVLKQRGQLPFLDDPDGHETLSGTNYTLNQAFRLRLLTDLIGGEGGKLDDADRLSGIAPSYAEKIVGNVLMKFDAPLLDADTQADVWVGVAILEQARSDGTVDRWSTWCRSELKDISNWIGAECASHPSAPEIRPVRLFMTNATLAANFVQGRALELGLTDTIHKSGS